ncbi:hypothetical protein ASPCAL04600 [Aspergillus calidoustus]|uniref:BZIP domain-containing protein n=1 Tax=Aspergillus calidoustus TaxID=454130 RepID=A0A0U5FVY8_ASPCI|nr:hypothetical protein ASPCAL04600 [Aspergillus calidoustus]
MEDYSQWCLQSPSAFSITSVSSCLDKDTTFQLELMNGMEHFGFYQEINMSATSFPTTPISSPVSPPEPDSLSQSGSQSSVLQITQPGAQCQRHHRRAQNREAQRRFRKRKEDLQKNLEQKINALESKCQELSTEFQQESDKVAQLQTDKEALLSENQHLRRLRETIVHLVQQLKVLQSLSSLATLLTASINPPSPSASPGVQRTSASASASSADETSITGCLDALLLILNDKPLSPK